MSYELPAYKALCLLGVVSTTFENIVDSSVVTWITTWGSEYRVAPSEQVFAAFAGQTITVQLKSTDSLVMPNTEV